MAIDGTDILESDLSIDVQNEILDRYDSGQPADEIRSYLKNELDNFSSIHMEMNLWLWNKIVNKVEITA